ncbi:hypothetical protein FQN57_003896 [Myotisia sp. PD_48]|nr:hypothetical protein FQN57_003896 [Myotisia sp. PD_48]
MPDFKLSASLTGHSDDVRAVAFPSSKAIFSASRDATVRMWSLVSSPPPKYDYHITSHGQAFVNTVAYAPPTEQFPEGLIFSAGQDAIIEARQPGRSPEDNAEHLLVGHAGNVCSLDVSPDSTWLVSGSWDSSARLWGIGGKWSRDVVFEGHNGSVWAVLIYDKETVVTGCADKLIRVFHTSGKLLNTIQGSGDVVRALCKIPSNGVSGAQFASAGNDTIIRLWTLQGQQVGQLHGHESFIYSLAALPSGELASSGEDRTVKIWQGTTCVQTITHPAISVWSVAACQENGDIVSGASDRVVRVFSRSEDRQADKSVAQEFENTVKESSIPQQQVGKVNKEQLPGPEFLSQKSGTKDGQVQMIREDNGSITAHTWSSATHQWIPVGTVVDSVGSSGKKTSYMGQDYDYVFDVDIEDGKPPLKLPYNLSQNPYEAAKKFVADNEISVSYLDQVANFIITNTQGASIGAGTQSETGNVSQQPTIPIDRPKVLPQTTYLSIKTANMKAIQKKISEVNSQLISSGAKDIALGESEIIVVSEMCALLEKSTIPDINQLETAIPSILAIATKWPNSNRLPGLDLLRLLAAAAPGTATWGDGADNLVSMVVSSGVFDAPISPNNAMLAIRMFANFFETEAGRELVAIDRREEVMHSVQSVLSSSLGTGNRNLIIAATTLYINLAVYFTSNPGAQTEAHALDMLEPLTDILRKEKDSESIYRGLVALGTLVISFGDEVRTAAREIYDLNQILMKVLESTIGKEPRVQGVIIEIRALL